MLRNPIRAASFLIAGCLLALAVACGDKKPPVAAPPPPPPPPAPVVQPPPPPPPPPPVVQPPAPPPPPLEPTEAEVFNRASLVGLNNGQLVTNLPGANNDLVFSARSFSPDPITVAFNDPGGQNAQLSVTTNGRNITVNLGRRNGQVTTTAADIAAAIAADPAANALVSVANKAGNNGSGVVAAMPAGPLQRPMDDVFFEFDKADLSEASRAALQKDADFLRKWTNVRITIEGHADARGTNEYNLALGERRAAATRDYLVSLGIGTDRVSVVSKGEEQPFCPEDAESCWAQNRRGHFIVTGK